MAAAITVHCPTCGSLPGELCRSNIQLRGVVVYRVGTHSARQAATKKGDA